MLLDIQIVVGGEKLEVHDETILAASTHLFLEEEVYDDKEHVVVEVVFRNRDDDSTSGSLVVAFEQRVGDLVHRTFDEVLDSFASLSSDLYLW